MYKIIGMLSLILLYSLLRIWQGLDVTDTGFLLATFQFQYTEPNSVSYGIFYWLTNILGGAIDELGGGLIGMRFANILLSMATGSVTYVILRSITTNRLLILTSFFVTLVYNTKIEHLLWGYKNLTAFLFVLAGGFLYFGLIKQNRLLVASSGLLLGISIFARTPNILGLTLGLAIPFYCIFLQNRLWQRSILDSVSFVFGWLAGIASMVFLLYSLSQLDFYVEGLQRLFSFAANEESYHSSDRLLMMFFRDNGFALVTGGFALIVLTYCFHLYFDVFKGKHSFLFIGVVAVISLFALSFMRLWFWVIPGVLYFAHAAYIWLYRKNEVKISLLALISVLILLLVPLGSGSSIKGAVHGSWIALPLVLCIVYEKELLGSRYFRFDVQQRVFAYRLCISILLVLSLVTAYRFTFRDTASRMTMSYNIMHPQLRGIYTTQERAKVMSELLAEMEKYVEPDDYLLAYNEIPLIHYLTRTKPWLGNPWPMLYSPNEFEERLHKQDQRHDSLPVIVRATGSTSAREWPNGNIDFLEIEKEEIIRQIMQDYIQERDYQVVWKNDFFEILRTEG